MADFADRAILVVAESRQVRESLTALIEPMGTASCVTAAQYRIDCQKRHRNVVVVDMAGCSDQEFVGMVAYAESMFPTRPPRFIALLPALDALRETTLLNAGAHDVLTMPIEASVAAARLALQLRTQRRNSELLRLATLDPLTGLANRRLFEDRLEQEIARHHRQQQWLSVSMIDIDHFKQLNDTYGHGEGDACLRRLATVLTMSTRRSGELVARLGGEEFSGVHPGMSHGFAETFGEHLCAKVTRAAIGPFPGTEGTLTVSVGICSLIPGSKDTAASILEAADHALYTAKHRGRNRCVAVGLSTNGVVAPAMPPRAHGFT